MMEVKSIPIDKIFVEENSRPEINDKQLADMMRSLEQNGLIEPVGVKEIKNGGKKSYKLDYGNRRYNAAKKLGWTKIDAILLDYENEEDGLILNLVENIHRKDVCAFAHGRMCSILMEEYGLTTTELAARLSITPNRVKVYLDLFKLTPLKYRKKVKSVLGGPNGKRGAIPTQLAHKIVLMGKSHNNLSKKNIEQLFEYSKRDDFTHENLKIIANKLNEGMSFREAFSTAKGCVTARVNITLSDKDDKYLNKMSKKLGISRLEALKTLLHGEKKIRPLERI